MATMVTEYQGRQIQAFDADKVNTCAVWAADFIVAHPGKPCVIDFQPGNGTRYAMVLTPLDSSQAEVIGNRWVLSLPGL